MKFLLLGLMLTKTENINFKTPKQYFDEVY